MTLDDINKLLANSYNQANLFGGTSTDYQKGNWAAQSHENGAADAIKANTRQIVSRNPDGTLTLNQINSDDGENWTITEKKDFSDESAVDKYFADLRKQDGSFLFDTLKEGASFVAPVMLGAGGLDILLNGAIGGGMAAAGTGASVGGGAGGLLGETAALNANQVGALSAEAVGTGASGSGFGQLAGSSVGEAFGAGAAPGMGSGLLGQGSAIASGAAGGAYVSPFASGALTAAGTAGGMSALTPAALAEIAATTGMSTAGLAAAAGGAALTSPVAEGIRTGINTFDDALNARAAELSRYQPSLLDRALDAARNNPVQAAKAVQGLLSVAGAVAGNDDSGGSSYTPKPIDQSIVDKYKSIPSLAPIRYQQMYNLALPTGLLDTKRKSLLGG